jgi:hypothetical protein
METSRLWRMAALLCIIPLLGASGRTEKRGVIDTDEHWRAENGPFVISDDVVVSRGARVIITPGTVVLVGRPVAYDERFEQRDHLDSFTVAIRVQGVLQCVGRRDNRITIASREADSIKCTWYGIVLENQTNNFSEIAFTDISGSCHGVVAHNCTPLFRNCLLEFNNVGLTCVRGAMPRVFNCVMAHNFASAVRVERANPVLSNNIIAYNNNNGVWSDGISRITLSYNCIFGNADGDLRGCDPELGVLTKVNKNGDSTDFAHNLFTEPVFAGTPADSLAVERDVSLPTDKSRVKDTTLAKAMHGTLTDSTVARYLSRKHRRYHLSPYSPCIDAGKPGTVFQDEDGTRNDIGIRGGREFADYSGE